MAKAPAAEPGYLRIKRIRDSADGAVTASTRGTHRDRSQNCANIADRVRRYDAVIEEP